MTKTQLARIAIALVVALFLWGLVEILGGGPSGVDTTRVIPAIDADAVTAITIERAGETTELARAAGGWTVNGYRADAPQAAEFLAVVADSVEGTLVAQSPSSHARLGVDADSGAVVRLEGADGVAAEIVVGKQGRAFSTAYVRAVDADAVYQVPQNLTMMTRRSEADWRDKTIVRAAPVDVGAVEVLRDGRRYRLERGPPWAFADGAAADSAAVERLLQRLASVETQGVYFATPAQVDSLDFGRPDRRLIVEGRGGDILADLAMLDADNRVWVRGANVPTVFQLFEWRANELTPADSTLRAAN